MAEQKVTKAPKAKAKETSAIKIETARKDIQSKLGGKYQQDIIKALKKQFSFHNVMEVPKISKIVVNRGVGEATLDIKVLDKTMEELFLITHQKPLIRRATKSIANFKLRKGQPIGAMITLRGVRMYAFLEKLIDVALPRIRDFKGLNPNSFDGRGNYTFGLKEQLIFPEIDYNKVDKVRGMNVSIITTAKNDESAKALLEAFGFPFRK
ncbi:MAG: 50S ribosomal protein L5 [Caldisericia bacterium]|nr:50S ribosomal protein L5 [Caldisericia bacterium]